MRRYWTTRQVEILRRRYANEPTADIARDLGRNVSAVYSKAANLGLKKSEEYLASPAACRTDGSKGKACRFRPGHEPWNKGKTFNPGGRSVETRFKTGNRPHNHVPVGSERVTNDGIRQRKISDTGYPPRDWKAVHALLWEEHNGPIPKGSVVVFRDGDRENIVIDNLECVTRSELMRRNTVHRYGPEVFKAIQLRGALNRQIRKRTRNEKQDRRSA